MSVVLVKRGLYYRPDSQGYTGILSEAGLYEDGYSEGIEGVTEIPVEEAPMFSNSCCRDVRTMYLINTAAKALRDGAEALTKSDAVVDVVWMPGAMLTTLHDHLVMTADLLDGKPMRPDAQADMDLPEG